MKSIQWVADSKKELDGVPSEVQRAIRTALFAAQVGRRAGYVKGMRGDLRGAMEIVTTDRAGTFRGIYYVGKELIYALHIFQKKSTHGIETPKRELDLIRRRLAWSRRQEREAG